jgi:L-alanine-DL-glutamate epimerase-like enolase superfamily enzyme
LTQSRRSFLSGLAVAGAAGCRPRPASRSAAPPGEPVVGGPSDPIPFLREKTGLEIQSLETFTRGSDLSVVRAITDDGAEGWGQISTYDADLAATVLHRKVAPHFLGRDPADVGDIVDRVIEANYKFPWSYVCRALTGAETAVWDLLGRRAQKPVCALVGGAPRRIPAYGSSMSRTITPEAEAARLVRLRDEKGFRAFKVRVGKVNGRDEDEWPGRTEALVPAVRRAVGGGVSLKADGNSCYRPRRAIAVGRLIEAEGFDHFEEPCPYWELEWTAEVARTLTVPVAGGEQDNDLAQWRRMIRMKAVDVVQPDVCYVGGLVRALRVARMAGDAGLSCVPHSANLAMVAVFTLHLLAAIPNAGPFMEYSIEDDAWTRGLYEPALEVRDGAVAVPAEPGWGVRVRPEWLERAKFERSERRPTRSSRIGLRPARGPRSS